MPWLLILPWPIGAVVGMPHNIKGQAIYAFVTPLAEIAADEKTEAEFAALGARKNRRFSHSDYIQWTPELPKTRSGKIMRRILRKIVARQTHELGRCLYLSESRNSFRNPDK